MYGIILDGDWNAGQDPISVVVVGDPDFLRGLPDMNCDARQDFWDRRFVERLEPISKRCANIGEDRNCHICRYEP
jgi:hypothetical protein